MKHLSRWELAVVLPALHTLGAATGDGGPIMMPPFFVEEQRADGIKWLYGADADLPSFLVARYFRLEIFSSALSLTFCATLFGSASGALLLSGALSRYKSFAPFLYGMSGVVLAGSLLFFCLPRKSVAIAQPAGQFA